MNQYLRGIRGCDGVPLSYVALLPSKLVPIAEEDYPSNTYATYDEEMVKIGPIVESGHASNAK